MKKAVSALFCVTVIALAAIVAINNKNEVPDNAETTAREQVDIRQTVTVAPSQPKVTQTQAETTHSVSHTEYKNPDFKAENITGAYSASAGTYTGYQPLSPVNFSVSDPSNTRGLSTAVRSHSFGVAKDSKPHRISVDSQNYFDSNSFNAITYDAKSTEKVLYLTFDCGYENGYTFDVLDTLKEKNVSAAFFCTLDHIKAEPELIARMIKEGHIVGNHSTKHPNFSKIDRTRMANEIQTVENHLRSEFGYSSPFFRFPEGVYTDSALDLVQSLGYKSVFWSLAYSGWDTSKQKGAQYAFDTVTARLHPGAIILLHSVSADNAEALGEIIDYALNHSESLHDYKPSINITEELDFSKEEKINKVSLIAFTKNDIGNAFWKEIGWTKREDLNYYDFTLNEANITAFNQ